MQDDKVGVFNPDIKDFSVQYDIDGNMSPKTFTAPAREISYHLPVIAKHIKSNLADYLLHKRGIKQNPALDKENIIKDELTV